MRLSTTSLFLTVITAIFISCTASKKTTARTTDAEEMEHVMFDTMTIEPEEELSEEVSEEGESPFRPSKERKWDLLHFTLDLSFDWPKEAVMGKATLTLTPIFYPQKSLRIDAMDFTIHKLLVGETPVTNYQNTGKEILLPLSKTYNKGEEIKVTIEYTASPRDAVLEEDSGITSDKGLYFIDPQDTIPDKPMQIWSQGETTSNRKWFPTLDQPNERCTHEITLTVADTMMTLSNGLLMSSTPLPNGMRRDHWKMDLPHAPYLAMIAVGQWDRATDYWRGRPVDYYVHKGYGPSARAIFAHTPEMMEYFSSLLGYEFVWPKYSQVVVKDYVSGAMENTTASIFGDFIEFDQEDELEEGENDGIVAHELFHQWFGDLVTCESWANLTLNEGFANYSEYLWAEHKYGRETADIARMTEMDGYYDEASYAAHPLIYYHYPDEISMFDAHSYNKGGLILHMLRDFVGDEAFFASLKSYLTKHAYQSVETDDLRQAFEEVTGRDLQWFFDQWYFEEGHPALKINDSYNDSENKLRVEIKQTQSDQGYRDVYILPIEIGIIHADSSMETHTVLLDEKEQVFGFGIDSKPLTVVIDPRDILLAEIDHDVPDAEYEIRAASNLAISHRYAAFDLISDPSDALIEKLMYDSSQTMRLLTADHLHHTEDADRLYEMSLNDDNIQVQYFLIEALSDVAPEKAEKLAVRMLETSNRAPAIYTALKALAVADHDEAVHWATHFENNPASSVLAARSIVLSEGNNLITLDFFKTKEAAAIKDEYLEELISSLVVFLSKQPASVQDEGLALVDSDFYLKTKNAAFRRLYMVNALYTNLSDEKKDPYQQKLVQTIRNLYNKETDPTVKRILKEGLGNMVD